MAFAKLQVVINFDSVFSLDSADHPRRNRPHLPHTRCSLMRWKANNESFILVLVLPPECSWIILCDRDKVLHHQFWAVMTLLSCRALSPRCAPPSPLAPSPSLVRFGINSVAAAILGLGFCLVLVFHQETDIFHCNCDAESFCCESGPPFLFYTTMAISPFVLRA
jgi:hypothetical protein